MLCSLDWLHAGLLTVSQGFSRVPDTCQTVSEAFHCTMGHWQGCACLGFEADL